MSLTQQITALTNKRALLLRDVREAEDFLHTNAMRILVATALNANVTDLTLHVEDDETSLEVHHATIDGVTYRGRDLPDHARPLLAAALELPAFTQHSFTDYLTELPDEQTYKENAIMRVDLALVAADYDIHA